MSLIVEAPTAGPSSAVARQWVRCRARTWQVLSVQRDGAHMQWYLSHAGDLPRLLAAPPDTVVPLVVGRRAVSARTWARRVRACIDASTPIWWPRHAAALPIDRIPLQYVPAMAMLSGHHRRLLLADGVGMGKTVQAAILLREVHAREPAASTLVVTPAALVDQWRRELQQRAGLEATVLDAAALRREAAVPSHVAAASRVGACSLVSVDLLRQPEVAALFTTVAWTLLVVDEAHLAAPGTARLAAVRRVAAASVRVLLLTATPVAAGTAGAEALRNIGARPHEAPMAVLRRDASASPSSRRTRVLRLRPGRDEMALHARLDRFVARARVERGHAGLLPALVLRRRASSCPAALVRSLERRLQVLGSRVSAPRDSADLFGSLRPHSDLEAIDDELMAVEAWTDTGAERQELDRLLALARACEPAGRKGPAIARLLARSREPAVIFTAYVDTLRQLRLALARHAMVVIHGQTPDALRASAIDTFNEGRAAVLLTTDASAEGLNLHVRCRLVVHADVPSSSRLFEQRTGRVDRYGQRRRVHAVVLALASGQDDEAMARVEARQDEDARWLTGAAAARCRRTELAARRIACAPFPAASSDPASSAPSILCHRLRSRRWQRIATRLGIAPSASSLVIGTLSTGGGALLSREERAVAFATPAGAPSMSMMEGSLGAFPGWHGWQRAARRARRLAAWEYAAARAIEADGPDRSAPGLFDDATEEAGRIGLTWRTGEAATAFSTAAILERRR